jgi:hypothetical protein
VNYRAREVLDQFKTLDTDAKMLCLGLFFGGLQKDEASEPAHVEFALRSLMEAIEGARYFLRNQPSVRVRQ